MDTEDGLAKIRDLYQHSLKLSGELKQLMSEIKPMEFESYAEYFLIHTFKKGISESGRVNINDVRRKEQQQHYELSSEGTERASRRRIRRRRLRSENPDGEESEDQELSQSRSPRSSGASDDNIAVVEVSSPSWDVPQDTLNEDRVKEEQDENNREGVSPTSFNTGLNANETNVNEDATENVKKDPAKINLVSADISTDYVIPPPTSENSEAPISVRRSTRLSEKERLERLKRQEELVRGKEQQKEEKLKRSSPSSSSSSSTNPGKPRKKARISKTKTNVKSIEIKDLYEMLVPKVKVPYRRSDWVLPPRLRYTPEKQLRTRAVFNSVKMYELVNTKSVRKILSRFEGGVAGVRKSDMENVK